MCRRAAGFSAAGWCTAPRRCGHGCPARWRKIRRCVSAPRWQWGGTRSGEFVEVAPHMRPAECKLDVAALGQLAVASVAVDLQGSLEALKMGDRALGCNPSVRTAFRAATLATIVCGLICQQMSEREQGCGSNMRRNFLRTRHS